MLTEVSLSILHLMICIFHFIFSAKWPTIEKTFSTTWCYLPAVDIGTKLSSVLTAAVTRAHIRASTREYARVTAVDDRSEPSMAVDRNRTCANAGDGLKN